MASEIDVSKINVYADHGVPPNNVGITKITMYAIVSANPPSPPAPSNGGRRWMAAIRAVAAP